MFISFLLISVFLYILFKIYLKLTSGICLSSKHLVGKVVIVTGGNAGIGFETAKNLSERGAKVILACRDPAKGNEAKDSIIAETNNKDVHFRRLDLESFRSVREFAENILKTETRIDVLINNAGVAGLGLTKTEDGLITGMQINHFAPFLLTNLLLPLLKSSAPSRIINVSSELYMLGKIDFDNLNFEKETKCTYWQHLKAYADSKLCNILMATEMSRQLRNTGVTINVLHPGAVQTDIMKNFESPLIRYTFALLMKMFYKNRWEGAQTSIYLAVSPEVEGVSGRYFSDCQQKETTRLAQDEELAKKLWVVSEKLVKLNKTS